METINIAGQSLTPIVVPGHGPEVMLNGQALSPDDARRLADNLRLAACQAECAHRTQEKNHE